MMLYDASKVNDVDNFARMVSVKMTPALAGFIVEQELMVDKSPEALMMKETATLMGKSFGEFVEFLYTMAPEGLDEFRIAVIAHISLGNDIEDDDSVGGFSQREIDLICDYLEA